MGLPPSCFYPLQAFRTGGAQALAQTMENFFRSGWDPLVLGGIDGSNAHPNLAGGGLSWSGSSGSGGGGPYPPKPSPPPHLPAPWAKRLVVELADETADARIRKKGATGTPENRKPGIEFIIDPTDTTYGKVCFVAKQDLSKQIGSVIVENPVTVTNPKIDFVANYGKMRVGTTGAFALELIRNGSTVTVEDRTGSAAITYDIRTVKFSNGTLARTLNTASYTLNGLADTFYSLAYDVKTTGTLSGYTATASSTTTLDLSSFTADSLAALVAAIINDIQTNGYLTVASYRCTNPKHVMAIDCDAYTLNGLARSVAAFMAEMGVSGLDVAFPSGTTNKLVKRSSATALGDSGVSDDGTTVSTALNFTVTGAATFGDLRTESAVYELSSGSNYNVAATVHTVWVKADALTAGQNADVTLPSAVTYIGRIITIKIRSVGAATSTLTVKSAAGGVEGAAAATGVPMDASARSKVTYKSDGGDWYSV